MLYNYTRGRFLENRRESDKVRTEPQTGVQLNREAWTEGRMILTEEQTALLKSQVDAFIDFIG